MKRSEYDIMFANEDHHWWFTGTRRVILDVARHALSGSESKAKVLDVGCGTGATLSRLSHVAQVCGVEMERSAIVHCRGRGIQRLARAQGECLPFADDSFDLVMALDVIEHIHDDQAAVAELVRVARPGATVLITVPAHPFLWSAHDEALHHKRRYRKKELKNVLVSAGLKIELFSYYNAALFPPIALIRLGQRLMRTKQEVTSDIAMPPGWMNTILSSVLGAERWWLRGLPLPFGVSLIVRAVKPLRDQR
jgi:SAM-dependent methyltransferase